MTSKRIPNLGIERKKGVSERQTARNKILKNVDTFIKFFTFQMFIKPFAKYPYIKLF